MKWLVAASLMVPLLAWPQGQDKVIDVRSARSVAGDTFDALWFAYRKAERTNNVENTQKAFEEIRRLRVERNIRRLEPLALGLVARGLGSLGKGAREVDEKSFRDAIALDPQLPDAHFGLALADARKGLLGILPAVKDTLAGLTAPLGTIRGRHALMRLLLPAGLIVLLVTTAILALVLVLRYGTLLLHDLEESFGSGRGLIAMGVFAVVLLFPVLTFQGYAWLPLWWLALVFIYLTQAEKVVTVMALLSTLMIGPVMAILEGRILAERNPLYRAAVLALEGGPDPRALEDLDQAVRANPDDRDLAYLLAVHYKKAARYDDASAQYRDVLRADPKDAIALNNLANVEFARGEFQPAIARYKAGIDAGWPADYTATLYYNLQLAYLQRFEFQPAAEAKANADRLSPRLVQSYDALWKHEKAGSALAAVVDLGLTEDEVAAKFLGTPEGVARKNVARKPLQGLDALTFLRPAVNRFAAFLGIFVFVVFDISRWRGKRMFTMRCLKCGTPFCKRCHLGASPAGLCTQCFHLFVVRDGVSGPARNRKLLEVQKEDERRERVFRTLSLLSPGAGHLYARKTLPGIGLVLAWYLVLVTTYFAGRLIPAIDAPMTLARPWCLGLAAVLLLVTYVMANRARADFEVAVPVGARSTKRARA